MNPDLTVYKQLFVAHELPMAFQTINISVPPF